MSKYYGQVEGQANTIASRRGSNNSGIKVSAQSWDGSVIVKMYDDKVVIDISDDSSFYGYTYFRGSIEELKKVLKEAQNNG